MDKGYTNRSVFIEACTNHFFNTQNFQNSDSIAPVIPDKFEKYRKYRDALGLSEASGQFTTRGLCRYGISRHPRVKITCAYCGTVFRSMEITRKSIIYNHMHTGTVNYLCALCSADNQGL